MTASLPSPLGPYVARVVREWLDEDPDALHRRVVGTVVLVDVSGFTKMSERLARFGQEGAESVTEVISSCFDRLLVEAYGYGATLLKFGGDALLLLFQGEGHEVRASAAALGMRAALRDMRTFDTLAGRVTLRMSVGVHSGAFDFFLVGGSHRELIISGQGATEVAALESAAGAGQILISPATAAAIARRNRGRPMAGGILLVGQPPVEPDTEVRFRDIAHDLTPYLPVGLRDVLAGGGAQPELRRASVAFLHFGGVDRLIERHGASAAARTIEDLVCTVQRAVDRREVCFLGTDIAPDGGKIILTAGAPAGHGEDEERMLLALRDIVAAEPPLPVRIGVNSGHVFAGEIGTVHRRTYTVMADAVNLAARLMARADIGQIVATRPVLRGSRTLFTAEELPPFLVKGKREPVTAFMVGAPRGVRAGLAASDLPLVGREDELAVMMTALGAVREGGGGLIEIVAEPGVGKSRFVDEVVGHAGGTRIHRVQCRQYQAATPYFVFHDLLRELLGLSGMTDAEALASLARTVRLTVPAVLPWLALVAIPLALEDEESPEVALLTEEFRKQRLERAVVDLLAAVITTPTFICFEDAHWMDESSADLLRAMEAELAHRPWLLCVTRRAGASGFTPAGSYTTRVELSPLGSAATARLLAVATVDAPLPHHLLEALAERSDGNPLFALELLEALRSEGDLEALPHSVEGLISARIDRLAAEDRTILRHVSVLGTGFWAEHVAAVWPAEEAAVSGDPLAGLGELLEVRTSGWVTFRHALVRDVVYAGLPFRTRATLHGRVAESILHAATDDPADQAALLSLHFLYAHRYPEAWRFARLAGDAARGIYANIDAITLYDRALQAARHVRDLSAGDRAETLERLGDVQEVAGLYDDARTSFRAAHRLIHDDPVGQARLALKEAFVHERRGRFSEAVRSIRRGQRLLDGSPGEDAARLRAQLTIWYAAIRADQGQVKEAARWSRAGVEAAEATEDRDALARALLVLDYAESSLGLTSGPEPSARALQIYVELGDLRGQATAANNLGFYAYYDGRWNEATALYEQAREARRKYGDPVGAALAESNIAEILAQQGRLVEAEELLRSAVAVSTAAGDPWGVAFAQRGLGLVAAREGRFDEAAATLDAASAGFATIGASSDVVITELTIAEALVLAGNGAEALPVLGRVLVHGTLPDGLEPLLPHLNLLWGLACLQAGEDELGRRELETAVGAARAHGARFYLALALEALQRIGIDPAERGLADEGDDPRRLLEQLGVVSPPRYPLPEGAVRA